MLRKIKKMLTKDIKVKPIVPETDLPDLQVEAYNENNPPTNEEEVVDNVIAGVQSHVEDLDSTEEDYISDEEWEKMTPEEKSKIEAEDEEFEDDDDDDYISDEEWEKMSDEEKKAWEEEGVEGEETLEEDSAPVPENVEDKDDPDYIKNSPEVVGFDDRNQQVDMYDIATEMIEAGESVLDFGCGRGDLSEFLYRRDGEVPNYKGVDINEPLINTGLEKYAPDVNLECKDWNALEDQANWCVNIGSLCTRYDGSAKEDFDVVTETIDKMMNLCTMGSVLVLFSSYMPKEVKQEEFLITDPMKVFDYAMKKYGQDTGNVLIDHSYSDSAYKITILRQQ